MQPEIKMISEKKCIGIFISMSYQNNQTKSLWSSFMPKRKKITNNIDTDLISLQVYPENFFENFNPQIEFEKWALVEVVNFDTVPEEFLTFIIPGGLYAVFHHKGSGNADTVFTTIYSKWLPASSFDLDNRPHFEILGDKYKHGDPESEEEIWIPIRKKTKINPI